MHISSASAYSSSSATAIQSGAFKRVQEISEAVQKINGINISAAAKRKALAVERLQRLQERLKMMTMFGALGGKGNAQAAARIAKEIAAVVKEYAGAGGEDQSASAPGLSKQDNEFISTAKRLSAQVKAIIAAEAEKARRKHQHEEKYQEDIGHMDGAIDRAEKTLRHGQQASPLYVSDSSEISLPSLQFSTVA